MSTQPLEPNMLNTLNATLDGGNLLDAPRVVTSKPTAPAKTIDKASVTLDQWRDGPVSQGDLDGTGHTDESFLHGNLNASNAHYNEGDAVPYRAILDNLTTGVRYGMVIQWDTVDSGGYAIDYLTGYNYSFDGTMHVGEPDASPLLGLRGISSADVTLAAIQADPQLLTGFGSQYGVTDGLASGLPSGAQSISLFGSVSDAEVSATTYNDDHSKASVTVWFTYTGSRANDADAVVVAWGGHIASAATWNDDASDTVQTASDISGSPYHMRVLSLIEDGTVVTVGNQDRSMQSTVVSPPVASDVNIVADEDGLAAGIGDTAPGDDATSGLAGTIPATNVTDVNFAAISGLAVLDTLGAAVTSHGHALTYFWDATGATLYASTDASSLAQAQATAAFEIQLSGTAHLDYAFTLLQALDHPSGAATPADDTENPNVLIDVSYTAVDGGSTTGTLHLTVDDDMPVRASAAVPIAATVREDGMSTSLGDAGDLSEGNRAPGGTLADDEAGNVVSGSLASLFNMGADGAGSIGFGSSTSGLPALFSKGVAVTYALSDANIDGVNDTLTATAGSGGDAREVFTLHVGPTGAWEFDLDDQLDHAGGGGESSALITALGGATSVASIDFSSLIQATDYDGDTVAPLVAGDFAITVQDDIPVRVADPAPIAGTVREDGMSTSLGDAGDLSEGNRAPAGTLSDDETGNAIAGSLASLVAAGADETAKFGFGTDTSGLPTLFSKGVAVSYALSDTNADGVNDTLTATAGTGLDAREVFKLHVGTAGTWEFDLDDQLDHASGDGENLALITRLDGTTSVSSIDFSALVLATDSDGDTVAPLLAGDFSVAVRDDVPVRVVDPAPIHATVYENAMSPGGGDSSEGSGGEADGDEASSTGFGALDSILKAGADEPAAYGLVNDVSGLPTLYSKGDAVSYVVSDADHDGVNDTLTASAGSGATERVVFTLEVAKDGSWTFDLDDQLDHVAGKEANSALVTSADGTTSVPSIDFSSLVTLTDDDGDSVALATGDFTVTVEDDLPMRLADATPIAASVREDGLSTSLGDAGDLSEGNRAAGGTVSDDQTGSAITASLASLFVSGADESPTIGIATDTSHLPTLYSKGEAVAYTVTDEDHDDVNDTLTAKAGTGTGERVVFTLHVDPAGTWTFDLDDQLDHVPAGGENTALITAANGSTSVTSIDFSTIVQVTDFDGDSATPLVAGDFSVAVHDDVPVNFTPASITVTDTGTATGSALLHAAAAVGADEPGTPTFVDNDTADDLLRDTGGNLVTADEGDHIALSGWGTGTLVGTTVLGGDRVFTATLDAATDHWSIDFDMPIDNGSGVDFLGAAPVKSGNPTFNIIDNVGSTPIDLLFSGGDLADRNPLDHTVNVSTQGAGTGNQTMNTGEILRIDFVTAASLTGSPQGRDFTAGAHQSVNGVGFLVTQNNPGGTNATMLVTSWNAGNDKDFTSDTQTQVTKVLVNGEVLFDNGTVTDLTVNGQTVHAIASGMGVVITGLNEGLTGDGAGGDDPVITVFDGNNFNRIEITNYSGQTVNSTLLGGGNFDIAPASIGQTDYGDPVGFNLPVQLADDDGDLTEVQLLGVLVNPITP